MDFGGAQKVFNTLNHHLSDEFEVVECVFNKADGYAYETPCQIHDLEVTAGKDLFAKLLNIPKRILRFSRVVKLVKPDIIISHLEGADYVSLLSFAPTRKICLIHGSKLNDRNINGFFGFLRKKLLIPYIYSLADHLVVVSHTLKGEIENLVKIESTKISTIYNSVDANQIALLTNEPIGSEILHIFDNKVLITCCRLSHEKNLLALLEIYAKVKEPSIKLVIVGDGVERESIIGFARALDLRVASVWEKTLAERDADLYLLGYHANPHPFVSKSKLFLLTSFNEGFPLGLIEAMACSTAVVAANCPTGPDEVIRGEEIKILDELSSKSYAGALMPIPIDEESITLWVEVTRELLANDSLRENMRENAEERLKTLQPSVIYGEWKKLIHQMVG